MPQRERRPEVGLTPTVAVNAAGWRIEPPVSVAVAPMQSSAATADADPPDEPPGTSAVLEPSRRHGLTTGPKHEVSFADPIANSSLLSLPSMTAPSRQSCEVIVDSYGGTKLPRIFEHAVVRTSLVANRSLMPSGMPAKGPPSPLAFFASIARAMARA